MIIADKIKERLNRLPVEGEISLSAPPSPEMGDLAFACFNIARESKKNPAETAAFIAGQIKPDDLIEKAVADGPYVNLFLKVPAVAEMYFSEKPVKPSQGKKIMVEYSQPNTHKEFHVGHLRNVCIGASVVELLKNAGNKVVAANYIGDIGAHVAKCLWYIKKYKMKEWPKENLGRWIGEMYTESVKELEKNPDLKGEVDEVQRKLEARDADWMKLWEKTRKASLDEFKRIYELIGNDFDVWFFESEEEKRGREIVGELIQKGVATTGEGGAIIVDLSSYGLDVFMVLKSDGSTLYATKDLALAEKKFKKYKVDESIVVIDTRQSFYFKQLFKTLELAGWDKNFVCLAYEFVKLPEGAMSSRLGNVVLFDDIYKDVFEALRKETALRHNDWQDKKIDLTTEKIALAAIKFAMLKHPINKVIEFNLKESVSYDGYTGPYVLYTIARIGSILTKSGIKKFNFNKQMKFSQPEEKSLFMKLVNYERVAAEAAEKLDPSLTAKYAFDLSKLYNDFYNKCSVLNAESDEEKSARLLLSSKVRDTLVAIIRLMNIEPVKEM